MKLYIQLLIFFFCLCLVLVGVIDKNNEIIELRAKLPRLELQKGEAEEELVRLKYELYQIENPVRLMELLAKPEFSHLYFPNETEVSILDDN